MNRTTTTRPTTPARIATVVAMAGLATMSMTPASAILIESELARPNAEVAQLTQHELVPHWLGQPSEIISRIGGPGGVISGLG